MPQPPEGGWSAMSADLGDVAALTPELHGAAGARDAFAAFMGGASAAALPDFRQDVTSGVRKVQTTLECFANVDAPLMSPSLSLPESLDGWLPPSTRHGSMGATIESLDGWLPDRGVDSRGSQDSGSSNVTVSPFAVCSVTATPKMVQGSWSRLTSASLQPSGSHGPTALILGDGTDDSPPTPSALEGQQGVNGGKETAGNAGEDNKGFVQAEVVVGIEWRKEQKRKKADDVEEVEREIMSRGCLAKNKIEEGATRPDGKDGEHNRPSAKRKKSEGPGQEFCVGV